MLKLFIILLVVSCAAANLFVVNCNDDEFAEFDEQDSIYIEQQPRQQKQEAGKQQQQPATQDNIKIKQEHTTQQASSEHQKQDESSSSSRIENNDKDEEGQNNNDHKGSQKKPDLKLANVPSIRHFKVESYYIEFAFLFATFLYLINFFLGSAKNLKFAQDWYEQSRELLKQQFALVGGSPTINEGANKRDEDNEAYLANMKKQKGLIKSSESLFTIWNSGRVGMEGLLVEIDLLKRQDLFSMALNILKASRDNLNLRFLLPQEGYENFVFCVAHRTQATKLVRDMVDVNTFCPKRKPASQYGMDTEKIVVMSELSDVSSFIFDQRFTKFLTKYERTINYIHITDHYSIDKSEDVSAMQKLAVPKRMATFSFQFPLDAETRNDYLLFSLSLLDRLRKFKLARDSKQKSDKNRQKIAEFLQKTAFNLKQEMAQAKKEELRRLEKERIYNEDDPEKQRKWEKKEAKREQKKNKMRLKQLKVKSM